jgi:hypothetical protein
MGRKAAGMGLCTGVTISVWVVAEAKVEVVRGGVMGSVWTEMEEAAGVA